MRDSFPTSYGMWYRRWATTATAATNAIAPATPAPAAPGRPNLGINARLAATVTAAPAVVARGSARRSLATFSDVVRKIDSA